MTAKHRRAKIIRQIKKNNPRTAEPVVKGLDPTIFIMDEIPDFEQFDIDKVPGSSGLIPGSAEKVGFFEQKAEIDRILEEANAVHPEIPDNLCGFAGCVLLKNHGGRTHSWERGVKPNADGASLYS